MKILKKLGLTVFLFTTFTNSYAGPSYEAVESFIEKVKVPEWQRLSTQLSVAKASSQNEQALKIWQELDSEADNISGKTPLAKVFKFQNNEEAAHKMAWLRWKVIAGNADARYSYAYATALSAMKDSRGDLLKEAAIFRWHAQLALKIDGTRCVDPTSAQNIALNYESQPQMQQLIKRVEQMPAKEKAITQLEAIAFESMRGERQPFGGLCTSGNLAQSEAIKNKSDSIKLKNADKKFEQLKDVTIQTVEIDTSAVEPKYIEESEWRQKRLEILQRLTSSATENL